MAVALRKESVDRNFCVKLLLQLMMVALRKESVDRNVYLYNFQMFACMSLSARRAWIEICLTDMSDAWHRVSLSARRAWIEIAVIRRAVWAYYVALRKESVDRNSTYVARLPRCQGRSPQGERG